MSATMRFEGGFDYGCGEDLQRALTAFRAKTTPLPIWELKVSERSVSLQFESWSDFPSEWPSLLMQVAALSKTARRGEMMGTFDSDELRRIRLLPGGQMEDPDALN